MCVHLVESRSTPRQHAGCLRMWIFSQLNIRYIRNTVCCCLAASSSLLDVELRLSSIKGQPSGHPSLRETFQMAEATICYLHFPTHLWYLTILTKQPIQCNTSKAEPSARAFSPRDVVRKSAQEHDLHRAAPKGLADSWERIVACLCITSSESCSTLDATAMGHSQDRQQLKAGQNGIGTP